MTEWDQFTRLDFQRIFDNMQRPAFIFDGRNLLDHDMLRGIGFSVYGIGKPSPKMFESAAMAEKEAREKQAQAARVKVGAARLPPGAVDVSENDDSVTDLLSGSNEGASNAVTRSRVNSASNEILPPSRLERAETFGGMA